MVEVGDHAPDFTVPLAEGDITEFTLSNRLSEAPIVLAFFPAAFSGTCTNELGTLAERRTEFMDAGATVYGLSTDMPYSLNAFRTAEDLRMGLLSDYHREVITAYDLATALTDPDLEPVAARAIVVVDAEQRIAWQWQAPHPGIEPAYDTVLDAVASVGNDSPEAVNTDDTEDPV